MKRRDMFDRWKIDISHFIFNIFSQYFPCPFGGDLRRGAERIDWWKLDVLQPSEQENVLWKGYSCYFIARVGWEDSVKFGPNTVLTKSKSWHWSEGLCIEKRCGEGGGEQKNMILKMLGKCDTFQNAGKMWHVWFDSHRGRQRQAQQFDWLGSPYWSVGQVSAIQ